MKIKTAGESLAHYTSSRPSTCTIMCFIGLCHHCTSDIPGKLAPLTCMSGLSCCLWHEMCAVPLGQYSHLMSHYVARQKWKIIQGKVSLLSLPFAACAVIQSHGRKQRHAWKICSPRLLCSDIFWHRDCHQPTCRMHMSGQQMTHHDWAA